jgi:hypothetical protein
MDHLYQAYSSDDRLQASSFTLNCLWDDSKSWPLKCYEQCHCEGWENVFSCHQPKWERYIDHWSDWCVRYPFIATLKKKVCEFWEGNDSGRRWFRGLWRMIVLPLNFEGPTSQLFVTAISPHKSGERPSEMAIQYCEGPFRGYLDIWCTDMDIINQIVITVNIRIKYNGASHIDNVMRVGENRWNRSPRQWSIQSSLFRLNLTFYDPSRAFYETDHKFRLFQTIAIAFWLPNRRNF